jgi:hypothetical protein
MEYLDSLAEGYATKAIKKMQLNITTALKCAGKSALESDSAGYFEIKSS